MQEGGILSYLSLGLTWFDMVDMFLGTIRVNFS